MEKIIRVATEVIIENFVAKQSMFWDVGDAQRVAREIADRLVKENLKIAINKREDSDDQKNNR